MVQALTVTGLGIDFPHAAQVAKIIRHRTCMKTGSGGWPQGIDQPGLPSERFGRFSLLRSDRRTAKSKDEQPLCRYVILMGR
ncbi:hypothetical protein ACFWOT_30135 [Streptomyces sp. NPDC058440]|uniref:hypothetical protein n=1 Tax=Streptomyces sp. NPDC058440 TaxID=3346501 RepID=UPI00365A41FC